MKVKIQFPTIVESKMVNRKLKVVSKQRMFFFFYKQPTAHAMTHVTRA